MVRVAGVHFDITDRCNAGCPQCARTDVNGCKPHAWLAKSTLDLEAFRHLAPPDLLQRLDYAYFCGNLGDPLAAPDLIPILEHCWRAQPKLKLKVFTNAGLRNPAWWRELGALAAERPLKILAAIDGASQETNQLYRVRTNYSRIMENMSAYIAAGGRAEWRMLVFKHNEHEVDAAEQRAREMGFDGFRAYPSNRFGGQASSEYTDAAGRVVVLEPPTHARAGKSPTSRTIERDRLEHMPVVIDCESVRDREIFIDFRGYALPCCHLGLRHVQFERAASDGTADPALRDAFAGFEMERLRIDLVGVDAAIEALDDFLDHLSDYWRRREPFVCKLICGKPL